MSLPGTTRSYLTKPWVRLIGSLLVIVAFGVVQYRLAHQPLAIELVDYKVPAVLQGQQLLILEPTTLQPNTSLLIHRGDVNQEPQAFLDRAVLTEQTRRRFNTDPGSASPQRIDFRLLKEAGEPKHPNNPCATDFETQSETDQGSPKAITFFQSDEPGVQNYRSVSLKIDGPVLFKLTTNPPINLPVGSADDEVIDDGPGCIKLITGENGWQRKVKGSPALISSQSEANSEIKIRILPLTSKPIWSGSDGTFEPFFNFRLAARSVRILSNGKNTFEATAAGPEPLQIDRLLVGSDQLQTHVIGKAHVVANGEPLTQDLLKLVEQNRVAAGVFVALNTFLVGWLLSSVKALFKSSEEKPPKRKGSKKK